MKKIKRIRAKGERIKEKITDYLGFDMLPFSVSHYF